MKKFFEFLQKWAVLICIFFGVTPNMPSYLQHAAGGDIAAYATWLTLGMSMVLLSLCLWWLFSASWFVKRPASMSALLFASVLGLMISVSALLAMYGIVSPDLYLLWRDTPAHVLQTVMVTLLFCGVFGISPFGRDPK